MAEKQGLMTAIYIRVSTDEQAREGFSINAQKEKLKQFALAKDWNIFDFYIDDGISGKNIKDRPAINRMLADVRCGKVENVLVYKIDRLTRSTKNLIELVELFNHRDCAFNSLMESIDTSSATGRMFIKIVGIFAEFERENLAERVSFGYEQKAREGNYLNSKGVYGYDYIMGEGKLLASPEERRTVEYIYQAYLDGNSMTTIAKQLIANGTPTKRGGRWCQSTIASILTNSTYIGKVRYGVAKRKGSNFEVDSDHEPIIDEDSFYRVQEIMGNRKKYQARRYPSENTYFLGTLFCANCGARMGTTQHTRGPNGTGKLYVNYYCYNSKNGNCDGKVISQSRVEQVFLKYIEQIEPFKADKKILEGDEQPDNQKDLAKLEKQLARTKKRMDEIKKMFVDESISFEEYRSFTVSLEEKSRGLQDEISKLTTVEEKKDEYDDEQAIKLIGNLQENWEYLTSAEKGQFLSRFVSRIEIYSHGKEIDMRKCEFYQTRRSAKPENAEKVLVATAQ